MRKLMWFTLGFASACGLGAYLLRGAGLLVLAAVCAALAVTASFLGRKRRKLLPLALALLGMGVGCGVFYGYDALRVSPARAVDQQVMEIRLTADSYSWETDYGSAVDGTIQLEGQNYRVRLYLNEEAQITPGDTVTTQAKLRFTDEGGVNEPTFHRSNGIILLAYGRGEAVIAKGVTTIMDFPGVAARQIKEWIDEFFPGDTAGFAKALLLGDRTDLDIKHSTDFNTVGISHVVAVSGLHVSILFSLVYLISGKRRVLTAVLGIPAVVLLAAMVGFTPSVTRAAIMQILMMLALLVNREYDPPTALAFSVLAILVWNPLEITSAGFQMSVSSVAGIYLFSAPIREWLEKRLLPEKKPPRWKRRAGTWLSSGISVSLSASVFTVPLVAVYYHTVSLVSVAANLLILFAISFIFYGTMLTCLLGAFSAALGSIAGWIFAWPIRYVYAMAGLLAKIPLAAVYTRSVYIVLWLVFVYCLIGWLIIAKKKRPLISAMLSTVGLCVALIASFTEPMLDDYRVTALDVGQGHCVILQSDGHTFVVDCGGDHDQDAGEKAAQTLLGMGVSRIDGLILTHYDRDHAGGVEYLAQRIGIDRVYLPQTPDTDGLLPTILEVTEDAEQISVTDDLTISFGQARINIFAPEGGKTSNESCAAVLFQREKYDTLITGDLSAVREQLLLRRTVLPDLEVLVVGHHGSDTSTSSELLERTAPDAAFISVGCDNSYGHPSADVLERLSQFGCEIFRTDQMGDLIYRR